LKKSAAALRSGDVPAVSQGNEYGHVLGGGYAGQTYRLGSPSKHQIRGSGNFISLQCISFSHPLLRV
jgi:hypothetical protein